MSPPARFGDLAAVYLARTWHRQPEGALVTDHSPELRAAGAVFLAEGKPTHPQQDTDGSWYDVPCNCDRTVTAEQMAADLELLRNGGNVVDRAMREAGFLPGGEGGSQTATLEPHHAAGKTRTAEEQAALKPFDNGGAPPPALAWYRNDTGQVIQLDPAKPLPNGVVRLSRDIREPYATGGMVRSWPAIVGEVTR